MKKAWLVIRLAAETIIGLIYMTGLFLLPSVWQGSFPEVFILGFLGMPRRYRASAGGVPPGLQQFNPIAALAGLLIVTFLVLNGLLWFKDVRNIVRKLRTGPS